LVRIPGKIARNCVFRFKNFKLKKKNQIGYWTDKPNDPNKKSIEIARSFEKEKSLAKLKIYNHLIVTSKLVTKI